MTNRGPFLFAALLFTFSATAAPRAGLSAAETVAFVEKAEGEVKVLDRAGTVVSEQQSQPAGALPNSQKSIETDLPLGLGWAVRTGANSRTALRFFEGPNNRVLIGARSHLVIETGSGLNKAPDLRKGTRLELKSGEADLDVQGRYGAGEFFEMRTPNGVAGVRGTRFTLSHSEAVTRLTVAEGRVSLRGTADRAAVDLGPGQTAHIGTDGRVVAEKPGEVSNQSPTNTSLK